MEIILIMRSRYQRLLLLFFLISYFCILDKDYVITGNVYQADGNPLFGVTVSEAGRGTILNFNGEPIITNNEGYYGISNSNLRDCTGVHTGEFSFFKEGYKSFTISVAILDGQPKTLDIIMERIDSTLDSRIKNIED